MGDSGNLSAWIGCLAGAGRGGGIGIGRLWESLCLYWCFGGAFLRVRQRDYEKGQIPMLFVTDGRV